jgi:hypothetical protein
MTTLMTFRYYFSLSAGNGNGRMLLGFSYVTERLYERIKAICVDSITGAIQHCFQPHPFIQVKL